jgi:hypothetical protein
VQIDDEGKTEDRDQDYDLHQAHLAALQRQEGGSCSGQQGTQPEPKKAPVQGFQPFDAPLEAIKVALDHLAAGRPGRFSL